MISSFSYKGSLSKPLDSAKFNRINSFFSKILVVVKLAISSEGDLTEQFMAYYDILVRNAFGNYRDMLKEISYSALMAENLSFLGSKSSAYVLARYRVKTSAGKFTQSNIPLVKC